MEPFDEDNPLRQVIVSTHSPVIAAHTQKNDLLFADLRDAPRHPLGSVRSLVLRPINGTWRDASEQAPASLGDMIKFLGSIRPPVQSDSQDSDTVYGTVTKQLALFGSDK